MSDGDRVVRAGTDVDAHCAVLQVHLLVALCAALAVGAPAIAGIVRAFLGLVPIEVILEDELSEVGGKSGRDQGGNQREQSKRFHACDITHPRNGKEAANCGLFRWRSTARNTVS